MTIKYLDPWGALSPKPIASHTAAWMTADVEDLRFSASNFQASGLGLGFGD